VTGAVRFIFWPRGLNLINVPPVFTGQERLRAELVTMINRGQRDTIKLVREQTDLLQFDLATIAILGQPPRAEEPAGSAKS